MNATPDPRPLYHRALDQTGEVVAAIKPDQLGLSTPCSEYDVQALLGHVLGGLRRAVVIASGGDPLAVSMTTEVPADGWAGAYRRVRAEAEQAWADDAALERMVTVPWGTVPGRAALFGYIQEVTIHGWDLAKATGRPTELDSELGAAVLGMVKQFIPAQPRGAPVPFGPVIEVPPTAGVYAQLAGWLGRQP